MFSYESLYKRSLMADIWLQGLICCMYSVICFMLHSVVNLYGTWCNRTGWQTSCLSVETSQPTEDDGDAILRKVLSCVKKICMTIKVNRGLHMLVHMWTSKCVKYQKYEALFKTNDISFIRYAQNVKLCQIPNFQVSVTKKMCFIPSPMCFA